MEGALDHDEDTEDSAETGDAEEGGDIHPDAERCGGGLGGNILQVLLLIITVVDHYYFV